MKKILFTIVLLFTLTGCNLFSKTPLNATSVPPTQVVVQNTPIPQAAQPTVTPTKAPTSIPTLAPTAAQPVDAFKPGFVRDPKLVDITSKVDLRAPASDLTLYQCFPSDHTDPKDPCTALKAKFPWGKPRAGYNFGYNDACRDQSRSCNVQIGTWKWVVFTGEALDLPGIGSLRDPDGGAVQVLIVNTWEMPGEIVGGTILHGFWATGDVWNMSDMTTKWNETTKSYENDKYGSYTTETAATLRDHYLARQTHVTDGIDPNMSFRGQCSLADNCKTITWVTVLRWYDGSFRLIGSGQWVGVNPTK